MFDNANIDGESLAHLAALEGAVYVVIKRAKIDDDALACLERLENLRQVSIVYCPVTDATVDRLARLERLSAVKLYGTRVTQTGAERLQKVLADAKIDWRKGAFLGVGGQAAPGGCTIGIVHPGSSAEAAGLRVGDVIVRYGDRDVADFDSLTALISANAPGDEVAIQFVRDGEKQTAKVTLGQWE
jgi:predicted metalloprotease with PDZ domain